MKLKITNNRKAPYGVEKVGGGYVFIPPAASRIVDAANPPGLYAKDFLIVEAEDSEVEVPPKSIGATAAKVGREPKPDPFDHDNDGKPGGSRKGRASTAAKGARRRRKAAPK